MRNTRSPIFIFCFIFLYSFHVQSQSTFELLDSAKTYFHKENNMNQEELDAFDFTPLISMLEEVLKKEPNNEEAWYYLGYTYSRLGSKDGRGLMSININNVLKSSEAFERVIQLTPKYPHKLIALDPYSKIASEWGSLAISYYFKDKIDSAIWAFKEGKNRGGYSDYLLQLNRTILNSCKPKAILMSSGDNYTFSLYYLQIVEKLRTDVSIADISLLNTEWYPDYLHKNGILKFDKSRKDLEQLNYAEWEAQEQKIGKFKWVLQPSYYIYLLRGDFVFLSALKANKFKRPVYFTKGFHPSSKLSLNSYTKNEIISDRLLTKSESELTLEEMLSRFDALFSFHRLLSMNSQMDYEIFDSFRYLLLIEIDTFLNKNDQKSAKLLWELFNQKVPISTYPFARDEGLEYYQYIESTIK